MDRNVWQFTDDIVHALRRLDDSVATNEDELFEEWLPLGPLAVVRAALTSLYQEPERLLEPAGLSTLSDLEWPLNQIRNYWSTNYGEEDVAFVADEIADLLTRLQSELDPLRMRTLFTARDLGIDVDGFVDSVTAAINLRWACDLDEALSRDAFDSSLVSAWAGCGWVADPPPSIKGDVWLRSAREHRDMSGLWMRSAPTTGAHRLYYLVDVDPTRPMPFEIQVVRSLHVGEERSGDMAAFVVVALLPSTRESPDGPAVRGLKYRVTSDECRSLAEWCG